MPTPIKIKKTENTRLKSLKTNAIETKKNRKKARVRIRWVGKWAGDVHFFCKKEAKNLQD